MQTRIIPHAFWIVFVALLAMAAGLTTAFGQDGGARRRGVPPDYLLNDWAGRSTPLSQVAGKRATVLLFLGTGCPISNSYSPELAAIVKDYKARGVGFAVVFANAGTTGPDALKHVKEYGLASVPVRLDPKQALADRVGAEKTPEVAVLDAVGTVRYCGRIDDRWAEIGAVKAKPTERSLRLALDALLAGKRVPVSKPAVGCVIERAVEIAEAGPTYTGEVAGILRENCVSCHRAGEIGPFPLETYEQAKRYAANIASVTAAGIMPPWKPVAGHGEFVGPRRLTGDQKKELAAWAEAGAPQGDRALAVSKGGAAAPASGWTLGTPDLVLEMPEAWKVPAEGRDIYRCFVLPTGLTQDRDVVAVEIRPGNRRAVHHVLLYSDDRGRARAKDAADPQPGYTSFGGPGFLPFGELGGWAPGNIPRFLPEGVGRRLTRGSDVIAQIHYHPIGKPEEDRTTIGIHFATKPVTQYLRTFPVVYWKLNIPPDEADYRVNQTVPVPFDARLVSVTPHMHLLGKSMKMTLEMPDGEKKPLVFIDDWDFKWQDTYYYKEAIPVPAGSKLHLEARFDNSDGNPRNPHSPPQPVKWGEGTEDEMCIGFVGFVPENENHPLVRLLDGRNLLGGF